MKTRNKYALILVSLLVVILLSACATPNPMKNVANLETGEVSGFWKGLEHGFTSPAVLIFNFFEANSKIYEPHNKGNLYDFGYLLGILFSYIVIVLIIMVVILKRDGLI